MSVIRHEVRPHLDPALHSAGTVLRRNQITSSKVSDAANALPARLRTVPAMPAQMYVSRPLRSHGVAARPGNEVRAAVIVTRDHQSNRNLRGVVNAPLARGSTWRVPELQR
jgi:hypothetical protein